MKTVSIRAFAPSIARTHIVLHGTTSPSDTFPFRSSVTAGPEPPAFALRRPMIPKSPERSSDGSAVSSSSMSRRTFGASVSGSDDDGGALAFDLALAFLPSAAPPSPSPSPWNETGELDCDERSRGSAAFCAECWETHSGSEESSSDIARRKCCG